MRLNFHRADFQALANLWNLFYEDKYRIDPDLLRINTVECPVFDWGASNIEVAEGEVLAFTIVKRSATPSLYKGQSIDQAHLCGVAYKEPQHGIDLLAEAKNILRNRGFNKMVFGADSRHFFPGCPCDCRALCDFLMVEGFESDGEVYDLQRNLQSYEPVAKAPEGFEFRPLAAHEQEPLREFLESEFPGRWAYDVMDKVVAEGRTDVVHGAFRGDRIVGFALVQDASQKRPISGAVWRNTLGENWSAVGPIGVAKRERSKGLGDALLSSTLCHLKSRGAKECIVDWTSLTDFYERHGFTVTRTYKRSSLKLGD